MKNITRLIFFSVLAFGGLGRCARAQSHQLLGILSIPGKGPWGPMAIDNGNLRIFVTHGDVIEVLGENNEKSGPIQNSPGAHSIAIDVGKHRGVIANTADSSLMIFDTRTLIEIKRVKLNDSPEFAVMDISSERIFAMAEEQATVVDARNGDVVGHMSIANAVAVESDRNGLLYFATRDGFVHVVDALHLSMRETPYKVGCIPNYMSFDIPYSRLFVGCTNGSLTILNTENGKKVKSLSVCKDLRGIAFYEKEHLIVSACGKEGVALVDETTPDKYRFIEKDTVGQGVYAVAVDENAHRIFLAGTETNLPPTQAGEKGQEEFTIFIFGQAGSTATPSGQEAQPAPHSPEAVSDHSL